MISRLLKILGCILLFVVVAVAGLIAYVKLALPNVGPASNVKIEATPARLERGKYLANHVSVCIDCHSERDWSKFSGPPVAGTLGRGGESFDQRFGFPGAFTAKNITPAGLGEWTDGEVLRAVTTGVSRDGRPMFPIMPYLQCGRAEEEDVKSIIAYVRTLAPVTNTPAPSKADFPVSIFIHLMPQKAAFGTRPPASDSVAAGAYLVNLASCAECHTKAVHGKPVGAPFAGGFEFPLGEGRVVRSANITPHATGIKALSREDFIRRFKAYADPAKVPAVDMAKHEFQTVMPWSMYAGMTEQDLGSIYDYLRTVAPAENRVEKWTAQ